MPKPLVCGLLLPLLLSACATAVKTGVNPAVSDAATAFLRVPTLAEASLARDFDRHRIIYPTGFDSIRRLLDEQDTPGPATPLQAKSLRLLPGRYLLKAHCEAYLPTHVLRQEREAKLQVEAGRSYVAQCVGNDLGEVRVEVRELGAKPAGA
ncbi:MAG: hypothetical protein ACOY41_11090 [Pseudomonadota bacterium]